MILLITTAHQTKLQRTDLHGSHSRLYAYILLPCGQLADPGHLLRPCQYLRSRQCLRCKHSHSCGPAGRQSPYHWFRCRRKRYSTGSQLPDIYARFLVTPRFKVPIANASGPYRTVDNTYTYLQDNGSAAYRQTIEENAVLFSNVQIISTTDYPSNLTTLIQYQYDFVSTCQPPLIWSSLAS
jgi:hypothetical protein